MTFEVMTGMGKISLGSAEGVDYLDHSWIWTNPHSR